MYQLVFSQARVYQLSHSSRQDPFAKIVSKVGIQHHTLIPFFQSYLHADQKLSSASFAVVLVKADLALDCIGSLSPTTLRTLGIDMLSSHGSFLVRVGKNLSS